MVPVVVVMVVVGCGASGEGQAGPSIRSEEVLGASVSVAGREIIDPFGPPPTSPEGETIPAVVIRPHNGQANTDLYAGTIGFLAPDQQVVSPVGDPPEAEPGRAPLTGEPTVAVDRPAVVVKLDNVGDGQKQTGLEFADIVFEEQVEGGFTRLAAVFQSQSTYVGPVRSGRTTDIGLLGGFGTPVFIYSGANTITDSLIRSQPAIQNHSFDTTTGFWRDATRSAPANVYTHLAPHWESAVAGQPPAYFHYLGPFDEFGGEVQQQVDVNYRQKAVRWEYDGTAWRRLQGGQPHVSADGVEITAANVIVVETDVVDTGMVDASGASVPEFVFVGSGRAAVFVDGQRRDGTWTKSSLNAVPTFVDENGDVIALRPGETWIQVISSLNQLGV